MSDLRIAEINYDNIVDNYIEFMRGQDEFQDLDFEASAIRRIISLLAYDLHYSAYYSNASFKEHFLDSAELRSSVVSHAKKYGYTPRSIKSSTAIVDVKLENGSTILNQVLQLPKGSKFQGTYRDRTETFDFVTTQTYSILADNIDLTFENVELVQGSYTSFDVRVDKYNENQIIELPSSDIDTEYLEVYVQSGSDTNRFEQFQPANGLLTIGNDAVYWLEEGPNGKYQIHFGDGVIGKSVDHGQIVRMVFIRTRGNTGNNVSEFTYSGSNAIFQNFLNTVFSSIEVSTLSNSQGGTNRETINEIKFRAPRYRGNGANALRTQDYEERIIEEFPEILSVRVFDASFLDDPSGQIGKIFISAVPRNGTFFNQTRKNQILNDIQNNIAGTNKCFEFVDPCFVYPKIRIDATLKDKSTKLSPQFVQNQIENSIINYNANVLERFSQNLEISDLICAIQNSNDSIDNIIMDIDLESRIAPCLNETSGYTKSLNNLIFPETFTSNIFEIDSNRGLLKDDGLGNLSFFSETDNTVLLANIGTINYSNGNYEIFPINITKAGDSSSDVRISSRAKNKNIKSSNQNILRIERDCIFVNILSSVNSEQVKYI